MKQPGWVFETDFRSAARVCDGTYKKPSKRITTSPIYGICSVCGGHVVILDNFTASTHFVHASFNTLTLWLDEDTGHIGPL